MPDHELDYPSLPAQDSLISSDRNTSGLVAMVLGIVSLIIGGPVLGIPAMILGRKGRKLAAAGLATNGSQATVGLVLGSIATALFCVVMLFVALRRHA